MLISTARSNAGASAPKPRARDSELGAASRNCSAISDHLPGSGIRRLQVPTGQRDVGDARLGLCLARRVPHLLVDGPHLGEVRGGLVEPTFAERVTADALDRNAPNERDAPAQGLDRGGVHLSGALAIAASQPDIAKTDTRQRLRVRLHVPRGHCQPCLELTGGLVQLATSQVQEPERVRESRCGISIERNRAQTLLVARKRRVVIARHFVDASELQVRGRDHCHILELLRDVQRGEGRLPGRRVVAERELHEGEALVGAPLRLPIAKLGGQLLHLERGRPRPVVPAIVVVLDEQIVEVLELEIRLPIRTEHGDEALERGRRVESKLREQPCEIANRRERRELEVGVGLGLPAVRGRLEDFDGVSEIAERTPPVCQPVCFRRRSKTSLAAAIAIRRRP